MTFKAYFFTTTIYGISRSIYWTSKVNDRTITKDNVCVYHPPTFAKAGLMTLVTAFSCYTAWPIFLFSDINRYEKSRLGLRDKEPPFPFDVFTWRDEK